MESDERYYRRRLTEELTAARRAVTPAAMARRMTLAQSFAQRLRELEALTAPVPEFAGRSAAREWVLELD